MLLTEFLKATKTIRFQLTLINSLIIFLFTGTLVLSFNVYANSYLNADPVFRRIASLPAAPNLPANNTFTFVLPAKFEDLQMEERRRIREIRLNDLRQIQELSLLSLLPIALLSFVFGYFLAGKLLQPLHELKQEINKIEAEDLGHSIAVHAEDEVGEIIQSFNQMSQRLKTSFESQARFVQDAAHELRTPLTIMQTNLDTVLDDPDASKQELRDGMADALAAMQDARRLTNNLLELAEPAKIAKQAIDIDEIIAKQINSLRSLAESANVNIEFKPSKHKLTILGDSLIERAIYNLIENAIKYSAQTPSANVSVSSYKQKDKAVIEVEDNGPGIALEHQSKIFDRFYRIDPSRNKQSGGFGLGLAIVKKVISEHNGTIALESEPGKTKFSVTIPLKS
jgi:signal transduction histidine kinase